MSTATIAHRLGTLRMFFVRIDEWGWPQAPPRVPMFNDDLPKLDHPLPKALDDAADAKLLRAAQNDKRLLVRTSCGTPWPPRRSTAACRWRRSRRCSGIAAWI